jgi:hypothetical protein
MERRSLPIQPEPPPDGAKFAVEAWNLMGGMDWEALPVVCAMIGVEDPEILIRQLVMIRDRQNEDSRNG